MTVTFSGRGIATITGVSVATHSISETDAASDRASRRVGLRGGSDRVDVDAPDAALDIRGRAPERRHEVSVERLDDDSGTALVANTELGVIIVGPPPVTGSDEPTDPDGDGHSRMSTATGG